MKKQITRIFKHLVLLLLLLCFTIVYGQDTVSVQQAVELGLLHNFSVKIARNNLEVSQNNNSLGNSGFYPNVSFNAQQTNSINTIHQTYKDNTAIYENNSKSRLSTANLTLNWTLFDGFEMFIEKDRYDKLQYQNQLQLKSEIENLICEIRANYYEIVFLEKVLDLFESTVNFSIQRKVLIFNKFKLGAASELAYLQALVDLYTDSASLLMHTGTLKKRKAEFNNLLGIPPDRQYFFSHIDMDNSFILSDSILKQVENYNNSIALAKNLVEMADLNYRLSNSPKYPKLSLIAAYGYSNAYSDFSTIEINQNIGPQIGFSISYPLFTGFQNKRNSKNQRIQYNSAQEALNQIINRIHTDIYKLSNDYSIYSDLIKYESNAVVTAKRNTYIAMEKFRLGELTDIELRQTQLKQFVTENHLLEIEFDLKMIEIEINRLTGKIVQ